MDRDARQGLFSRRELLLLPLVTLVAFLAVGLVVRRVCYGVVAFDCPYHWPISIVELERPTAWRLGVAAAAGILFVLAVRWLAPRRWPLAAGIGVGVALILATNLVQGVDEGFSKSVHESQDESLFYYSDARNVTDPVAFVSGFNDALPSLLVHSQTHPPGAVLTYWLLHALLGSPLRIAVAIAVIAGVASAFAVHGILRRLGFEDATARYGAFLLLLLPAVQIYYASSLDALVASLFLLALRAHLSPRPAVAIGGTASFLFLASFLTYLAVFLAGLLVAHRAWEVLRARAPPKALVPPLVAVALVPLAYALLALALGFDYLGAFRFASRVENPEGFRLLAAPVDYLFTRLEGAAEPILFFGPFLAWLAWKGLRPFWRSRPSVASLSALAALAFLGLLGLGVYRTGETARAASFLLPLMMLPVLAFLEDRGTTRHEEAVLAGLVFGQALLMQTIGDFLW